MGRNSLIWENEMAYNIALNHNSKKKGVNQKLEAIWITEQTGLATAIRIMPD